MANVTIKLSGWDELQQKFKTLGPKMARKVGAKALKKAGEIIADYARILVPVETGKLQDSITVVAAQPTDPKEVRAVIGFRGSRASIAHLVEYGTSKMQAQPFIRPALDAKAEDAIAVMGTIIWAGIEAESVGKK